MTLAARPTGLHLTIDAPFHDDPPPPHPPGSTPALWEHEVVELFLFGDAMRYLEIEVGPWGHYLALSLAGARNIVHTHDPLDWHPQIVGNRWSGQLFLDRSWLPLGPYRYNAHAIHGTGQNRRYLSTFPAGGLRPDFHRPEVAQPLPVLTPR